MVVLSIRRDRTLTSLRLWVRRTRDAQAVSRAYAIANALEGMTRAEAARLAGMEHQALRDVVVRYNAEGVSGLSDRPRIRPSRLTEGQQAVLRGLILRGPDPQRDGISSWTRADIAELEARFGHRCHVSSLSKILRNLGFSRQKTRPSHPNADPKARAAWLKKGAARMFHRGRQGPSVQADRAFSRMKQGLARRAAPAIAGGCVAEGRPGRSISAMPRCTCSRRPNPPPVAIPTWYCPPFPRRR